ncbi:hybrid sensor histidine kinase/response regulator [Rhodalgimonas zhirmunskyi]|uniref:histidine kinase n=1 Tax=Rhodalgimonas zhirmunskyi TaxID=2964767 RepID=A0AAJ1X5C0_9RHOB|nr:PAS-domain containing protein [Rhodoalgimonas zhirmunskyi]MDQ2095108.1 PAS-domain containing protein [Rhodoalgimonas zhirmunskyi]
MPTTPKDTHAMTMAGLNLIQQALSIYDRDLKLVIANAQFRDMFSLPVSLTMPGADFAETIRYNASHGEYGPIDDLDQFVRERVETARAFEPHYMERTRANGRTISVEGSPLPQGGWVTVYTDITATKRAEQLLRARSEELSGKLIEHAEELSATNRKLGATVAALEEAKRELTEIEARTRLVTEMMPAHIAHVGPDFVYTFSNRRVSSVMPGSKPDPVGLRAKDVLGPQPWRAIAPHLERAVAGAATVFEFNHEPSSRRIRVALTPDPSTGGAYILSTDVTEESQTRASLQQHRRREIAARMISGLAHDFANLLTIVLGTQSRLARLVDETSTGQEAQELIAATLAAARRGGTLLNRIADMTSARALAPRPTDIPAFLRDFETLARAALPDGVTLSVNTLIPEMPLMLDPGLLQDSLLNLVLNARDACAPHGTITLTARPVQDTWIEFAVSDSGPGFSDEALAHAFEPFFTTKGGEGSGLGLASVYDNTKLAGGHVTLANRSVGSTRQGGKVTLRLPRRPAPAPTAPGLVLLVEDSDDLRATIRAMLTDLGHSVIEASSVDEALALATTLPDIALILSDITLEGSATGIDLAKRLPAAHPPFYLMTSLPASDPLHEQALTCAPVLAKPFSAQQLGRFLGQISG